MHVLSFRQIGEFRAISGLCQGNLKPIGEPYRETREVVGQGGKKE